MVTLSLDSTSRTHTRYKLQDDRYWKECARVFQPYLSDALSASELRGEYWLRPFRKTQWRADPLVPFKVTGINEPKHAVEVTIRSPHNRGATVWEFFLIVPAGVLAAKVYQALREKIIELEEQRDAEDGSLLVSSPLEVIMLARNPITPEVATIMLKPSITDSDGCATAPKVEAEPRPTITPTAHSLLENIKLLETHANREKARRAKIAELGLSHTQIIGEVAELESIISGKRDQLNKVEDQIMVLEEESENDKEAKDAAEALTVLGRVLTGFK